MLLILYLLLGFFCELQAQTNVLTWRWSNPQPHGGNIVDMTAKLGVKVQVAERGQLYTSDDFLLWIPRNTGVTNSLRSTTFLGERLIVTAENGLILYADSLEEFIPVSLGTTDWLESVAASDNVAVAVGDNGSVYISSDGASWTQKSLKSNNKTWLRSVAYGGNAFVAVGENGYIATGNNAAQTWSTGTSGVSVHLNRVAYINNKFWAVGNNGTILNSTDGSIWTKITSVSITNNLYAIAGTNTSVLVAGEQIALMSEDSGTTWKNQTLATDVAEPAPKWTYYSAIYTDSTFLLAGRSGMTLEGFKTNTTAQVWVERNDSYRQWLWGVVRLPSFYLAVGDHGTILTSSRGANWDLELPPTAATNSILLGVGGTTNGAVIVGNQGTILFSPSTPVTVLYTNLDLTITTNQLSSLGTIWQAVTPKPVSVDLQGVGLLNELYLVCGGTGTILTSKDATNWFAQNSGTTAFLSGIATNSSLAVVVGNLGTILTSPNGTNWTARNSGTTRWLFRVKQFDGTFVAVGEQGTVLTSSDGIGWTARTTGVTNWLNDIERINGEYFVAGNQGTLLRSTNLINWVSSTMPTQKSLFGLAANGGQLVTVGVEGAVLRSPITLDQTPVQFVNYGVAAGQSLFLLSGNTDQKFAIQNSTNLVDWVEGVTFEIVDRSGTLLIKQVNDTTVTNQQFLRARMAQ